MNHDRLYKEIYLHCTKHCIRDPHTKPFFPLKKKQKAVAFFSFVFFPNYKLFICPWYYSLFPQPSVTPTLPTIFHFQMIHFQAVTKPQSTGQLLNFSSRLSVRQAVYKSSVSQITALEDVLSLTYLRSSKAFQCLWNLMKMNSSHWKTTEVIGNQSNLRK